LHVFHVELNKLAKKNCEIVVIPLLPKEFVPVPSFIPVFKISTLAVQAKQDVEEDLAMG
jgi:hypothetical protein